MRVRDWVKVAAFVVILAATFIVFWIWGDHVGSGVRGPRSTP